MTYVPPPPPDSEDAIFAHYQTGINFDKYDNILVEVSGHDSPAAILVSDLFSLLEHEFNIKYLSKTTDSSFLLK